MEKNPSSYPVISRVSKGSSVFSSHYLRSSKRSSFLFSLFSLKLQKGAPLCFSHFHWSSKRVSVLTAHFDRAKKWDAHGNARAIFSAHGNARKKRKPFWNSGISWTPRSRVGGISHFWLKLAQGPGVSSPGGALLDRPPRDIFCVAVLAFRNLFCSATAAVLCLHGWPFFCPGRPGGLVFFSFGGPALAPTRFRGSASVWRPVAGSRDARPFSFAAQLVFYRAPWRLCRSRLALGFAAVSGHSFCWGPLPQEEWRVLKPLQFGPRELTERCQTCGEFGASRSTRKRWKCSRLQ